MLRRGTSNQKGFTLIELLIVIAIVDIMAAIVIINIAGVRTKTQDAKVKNDLTEVWKAAGLFQVSGGKLVDIFDLGNSSRLDSVDVQQFVDLQTAEPYLDQVPVHPLDNGATTDPRRRYFWQAGGSAPTPGDFVFIKGHLPSTGSSLSNPTFYYCHLG